MSEEWIKNLKVGDKVIVDYGGCGDNSTVKTVDKITPSGLIGIGGALYRQNGDARGKRWSWLREAIDKEILRITQRDKINNCLYMMHTTKNVSYDQAVAIIGILEGETK